VLDDASPNKEEHHASPNNEESVQSLGSFVPVVARNTTEERTIHQATVQNSIDQSNDYNVIPWPEPQTDSSLINKFTTERCISCAFPMLFPIWCWGLRGTKAAASHHRQLLL